MIQYTGNILSLLEYKGYPLQRLRDDKILGQATIAHLRNGEPVSWKTLDTICRLLHKQPGDLIRYVSDSDKEVLESDDKEIRKDKNGSLWIKA